MKYIEDKKKTYEKDIIKHLKAHNDIYVGDRLTGSYYLYVLENNKVIGRLHTSLFWDWISLNDIYYEDINSLASMLHAISYCYHNYVGLKHFTCNKSDESALITLGFEIGGYSASSPKTSVYTYLKSLKKDYVIDENLEVIRSKKILHQYENHEENPSNSKTCHLYYVALDEDDFAGGIHAIIEDDSMYISRLSVHPDYQKRGIGTKLMSLAEKRASKIGLYNITTGTCSFQAKDFYEKLGYTLLFTKENDPRGYDSYSFEKVLQKEQND